MIGNIASHSHFFITLPCKISVITEEVRRSNRIANKNVMALTNEQLVQVLAQMRTRDEKSFADLTARFNGARNLQKVEEFISRASIFKDINNISDENAIKGLPLLLEDTAATWWQGIKTEANTWAKACQLIQRAFSPAKPSWRVYSGSAKKRRSD